MRKSEARCRWFSSVKTYQPYTFNRDASDPKVAIMQVLQYSLVPAFEVKADWLQDLHIIKFHDISMRARVDFGDSACSEDRVLHLVVELESVRWGFAWNGRIRVFDLTQTFFVEIHIDDIDVVKQVLLDFKDEA